MEGIPYMHTKIHMYKLIFMLICYLKEKVNNTDIDGKLSSDFRYYVCECLNNLLVLNRIRLV
jgi:hypothetical protein